MASLRKQATKLAPKGLFLLVIGPSKAGKSHLMGTNPKGNTLVLHGQGEKHGVKSAAKTAKDNLIPVQWPANDELIKWFKTTLTPAQMKEDGITCVCIDSLTDLFRDIRDTKAFKQKCMTSSGKHNSFAEASATIDLMSKILSYLEKLRTESGVQVICSMHATITHTENGQPSEVKPDLPTFGVAAFLVRYFGDILVMNDRKILTGIKATRQSKNEDGHIVKFLDFKPCLDDVSELPEEIEPSIEALLKLKGV